MKKNTDIKPAATPTFCKQNFSQMHQIDFIHTLYQCPFICLKPGLHTSGADQSEQQRWN